MNLIYEGVDITSSVQIQHADVIDCAGGKADSVRIVFNDTKGLWSRWNPQKGAGMELIKGGFSSGTMYFDQWEQEGGLFIIYAISTPLAAKQVYSRSWENIQFFRLATDLANAAGLTLQTYDITNWQYDRFDQHNETPLAALQRECMREGYALKVTNGKAVIFDERTMEVQDPVDTFYKSGISEPKFKNANAGLCSACTARYVNHNGEELSYTFTPEKPPQGPVLKINERLASLAEAERFSKGYLRNQNKFEQVGAFNIAYNSGLAAGNTVGVLGMGISDGIYYLHKVIHRLADNQSRLYMRCILEGY